MLSLTPPKVVEARTWLQSEAVLCELRKLGPAHLPNRSIALGFHFPGHGTEAGLASQHSMAVEIWGDTAPHRMFLPERASCLAKPTIALVKVPCSGSESSPRWCMSQPGPCLVRSTRLPSRSSAFVIRPGVNVIHLRNEAASSHISG